MYTHTHTHTHTRTCTHTHARTHTRTHARTHTHTHARMHARTLIHPTPHINTRIHTNTHTHTYTRTRDAQSGLLNLRNTPRDSMRSPAQRLLSTRTRTTLPTSAKLLKPKPLSTSRVSYTHLKKVRRQQKQHHDKSARHQPPLKPYEVVYRLFKKKSCFL